MPETLNVFLIDDHPTLRLGLKMALQGRGVQVMGEAGSVEEGLQKLEGMETAPDVILLDIDLPGMSGLAGLEPLTSRHYGRPVMFTHHRDAATIERALAAGAQGFLSKEDSPETITVLLQNVMRGRLVLSPTIQSAVYANQTASPLKELTPRELEVLRLLVHGFKHKEIAERLNIAPRTVDFHRQNLKEKLEAEGLVDLVRIADRYGLS